MPRNVVINTADREEICGILSFVFNSIDDGAQRNRIEYGAWYIGQHGCLPPDPDTRKTTCKALKWYCAGVRLTIKATPHHVSIDDINRIHLITQVIYAWGE